MLVWAAWTHDPRSTLSGVLGGAVGKSAIVVVAFRLGCFGLFLAARAWHLNRESLTS